MNYWLLKSEPHVYSIDDLISEGEGVWDGVRNYQARNNLRAMLPGDLALFYHSNIGMEVVGLVEISASAFQDPTTDDNRWLAVGVKPVQKFAKPIPLKLLKADPFFEQLPLVRHSRLSVMPVDKAHFDAILALGNA
ncbi:MAG: EVE domain-containing protein [Sphingobacteriaceae bacterium]|nr:EVE domain-containing protein [Sphingobacteriaceae bacterium]